METEQKDRLAVFFVPASYGTESGHLGDLREATPAETLSFIRDFLTRRLINPLAQYHKTMYLVHLLDEMSMSPDMQNEALESRDDALQDLGERLVFLLIDEKGESIS